MNFLPGHPFSDLDFNPPFHFFHIVHRSFCLSSISPAFAQWSTRLISSHSILCLQFCATQVKKCSLKTRDLLWFYDLPVLPWCHWGQEQKPEVLHRVRWYLEMHTVLLLNAVPFRFPYYLVDRDLRLTYAFTNIFMWNIKESHPCTRPLWCNSSVLCSAPQI